MQAGRSVGFGWHRSIGEINKPKEANEVFYTFIQSLCVQGRTHTVRLAAKACVVSSGAKPWLLLPNQERHLVE